MAGTRPSQRAKGVWRRLAEFYGARLADQFGAEPPPEWCKVIDRTDPERLEKGLMAVRRDHLQHPPSLPQFEACIPRRKFGTADLSVPDRLAAHARATLNLCEHQVSKPWSFFGQRTDDGSRDGAIDTRGVVIPACRGGTCANNPRPSHRVTVMDLPAR